jgi:hypothetical protein
MIARVLLSLISIVFFWALFDSIFHRLILAPLYEKTAHLWRPFEQMNRALISIVTLGLASFFVLTFALLIRPKSLQAGMEFGALAGMALGLAAGFGTYIHSPIPLRLAWGWFIRGWLKAFAAGVIVGLLIR